MDLAIWEKALLLACSFMFFWFLESLIPLLRLKYKRIRHAGINLFFIITNIIVSLPIAFLAVHLSEWTTKHQMGVLHVSALPSWIYVVGGLVMLDFLAGYLPHYVQHKVKWMWKFHLVHHTDTEVDTSTANRHHPGETVLSMLFLLPAIVITGAPAWLIIVYQLIATAFGQFIHANISLPRRIDAVISWIFISPNMHKVHHHQTQPLTDTNYGNIFSIWDRLFKTFVKSDIANLKYGIDTHPHEEEHNSMSKLMALPFTEYRPATTSIVDSNNSTPVIITRPLTKIIRTRIPSQV